MPSMTRRRLAAALTLAAAGATAPLAAQADQFVNILTGGTSGVYYPLGVALGKIYAEKIPGVRTQVQSTKASVENLNLLQTGRGEIALALGDSVKSAWEGDAEVGFPKKLDKLRGVAAVYPNVIQIVASQSSGIKTFADLKGKSLSVGAPKSGTEVNARRIFEAHGHVLQGPRQDRVPALRRVGRADQEPPARRHAAVGRPGRVQHPRPGHAPFPMTMVAVPADVAAKLGPPFVATTIPANTYNGQTADVPTLAVVNFLVTHAGVSDETVYQMTKQLFENLDQMVAAHNAAKAITLETATDGMPLPLHPGAERYYKEKGLIK